MTSVKRHNFVGMHTYELQTPVLIVDLDVMELNVKRMADFFRTVDARLRPHTKTHKTPALAHLQVEAGAHGICCGNLEEAEVMISAGIRDVLVTREIVLPEEAQLAVSLGRNSDLMVLLDNREVAQMISGTAEAAGTRVKVLVDIDFLGRSGVALGGPALELVEEACRLRGLEFIGLCGYEGSMHTYSPEERERRVREALHGLMETKRLIEKRGHEVRVVTAGSTSTYRITGSFPGITDVQAGSYITMDAEYASIAPDFEIALGVLATVVSRPAKTTVTIDAGLKKLSTDAGLPFAKDGSSLRTIRLFEEHGLLELTDPARKVNVGDKLEIVPSHGCTTFNLYDELYGIRKGRVEAIWAISGRGT